MKFTVCELRHRPRLFAAVGGGILLLVTGIVLALQIFSSSGDGRNLQLFDFSSGYSSGKIAAELKKKRIIGSARVFVLYSRLKACDAKMKAGTYQFSDGMSISEIVRKLVNGETFAERFPVPEGYSTYQIAEMLEGRGIFKKEEFLNQCRDLQLIEELEIDGPSVEGYLYPSTYDITPNMSAAEVITMMVEQFRKVCAERLTDRLEESGMPLKKVLILASMVEKEAVVASERPLISSVFHNRLRKGMRLQSDPTAVYGVRAFAGKVSKQDILRSSAYNTYRIAGLPPGPVGNPGISAIEAVLNPAVTPYLYFVARKDGTHHFSETLNEHNDAVRRFLRSSRGKGDGPGGVTVTRH